MEQGSWVTIAGGRHVFVGKSGQPSMKFEPAGDAHTSPAAGGGHYRVHQLDGGDAWHADHVDAKGNTSFLGMDESPAGAMDLARAHAARHERVAAAQATREEAREAVIARAADPATPPWERQRLATAMNELRGS